jgi:uncharacterized protein
MAHTFLKAEWRKLAMANYEVDPSVFQKYLPYKTELDMWHGRCYASLVGFLFTNVRVLGLKIPFHHTFEEVNLRFYVRYNDNGTWKRGVVFIKEIVPRMAITLVANTLYKEHYETMLMRYNWQSEGDRLKVSYEWKKEDWHSFHITAQSQAIPIEIDSEEEFITEHYWGYTMQSASKTSEYGVEHPRWNVYPMIDYAIHADFQSLYGADFAFLNDATPTSVFLAEGSEIEVKGGRKIQ